MIKSIYINSFLFLIVTILILACNQKKEGQNTDSLDSQKIENNTEQTSNAILDLNKRKSLEKLENFEYEKIDGIDLLNLDYLLSNKEIIAKEPDNNQIKTGSIIIYKTSKRLVGKLQILEYKSTLRFKATTYFRDGSDAYQIVDAITLRPMVSFDLDEIIISIKDRDFSWEFSGINWKISPKNNATFYVQTKN